MSATGSEGGKSTIMERLENVLYGHNKGDGVKMKNEGRQRDKWTWRKTGRQVQNETDRERGTDMSVIQSQ